MSARLSKLEALLSRLQRRSAEPRNPESQLTAKEALLPTATSASPTEPSAQARPSAVEASAAQSEPSSADDDTLLSLDSPSIMPPASDPEHFEMPELDEPMIDVVEETLDRDQVDVEIDSIDVDSMDFDDLPESGPVASTLDRDLDGQDEHPITPPPESTEEAISTPNLARNPPRATFDGPQSFTPPQSFVAPQSSDEPSVEKQPSATKSQPTMEQVGETVELEESDSPTSLELDEPITQGGVAPAQESVREASILPERNIESVRSPAETAQELERYRLGESANVQARVSQRPILSTNVVELVAASTDTSPKSFFELLDATLTLK